MRVVIDLQGVQSPGSRHRGIGRYSLAVAEAMVRQAGEHEVWLALNGAIPDTIESLRAAFDTLIPQQRIVTWDAVAPVGDLETSNIWRRQTSEVLRESFFASLRPDFVHVTSLFEGLVDDVVTSIGTFSDGRRTAVTLYDLIPLIHHDPYLTDPRVEAWYQRKLTHLRRAGLWLAISESSRREGIDQLGLPHDRVVNISAAADARFRRLNLRDVEKQEILQRYGLVRPFVMYTAATDPRKNLGQLFAAYAKLPARLRREYQLLIVCPGDHVQITSLMQAARELLDEAEVVIASRVPDEDLIALYNLCTTFCFPSLHEGFGLPALEAMQCGAATIGANTSSVPEVIGRPDALFDPRNAKDIAACLHRVLTDSEYRMDLVEHGIQQARKFSWDETARRAWAAFEASHDELMSEQQAGASHTISSCPWVQRRRLAYVITSLADRHPATEGTNRLLPELARFYEIDVITDGSPVRDPWINANCSVRDFEWFDRNAGRYDRILYQLSCSISGNSILGLVDQNPGVVLLPDVNWGEASGDTSPDQEGLHLRMEALYHSHGYTPLGQKIDQKNADQILGAYPAYLPVLQNALGVVVGNADAWEAIRLFYGRRFEAKLAIVHDLAHQLNVGGDSLAARSGAISSRNIADQCSAVIEDFYANSPEAVKNGVLTTLAGMDPTYQNEQDWLALARACSRNLTSPVLPRQLFVDISELVQRDSRTGIQRVTRSILSELIRNPPKGFRVEPVYAAPGRSGYIYAREFTLRFLGQRADFLNDEPISFGNGDIFLGLDLQHHIVISQESVYGEMRKVGVQVHFVVYDLLPIRFPHLFRDGIDEWHDRWLSVLSRYSDGLLCISSSVADELIEWLNEKHVLRERPLRVQWFHLGADIEQSVPTRGLPENADQVLSLISANPTFLMVGTIEPRKGHAQILGAFEELWKQGLDVNLVFVGQQGWRVEDILNHLRMHPELDKRLFWLEGISDEYLESIYAASVCLIAASEGEGFGLPLIEAARHSIPILARNIPVFREVAGDHAAYFQGNSPSDLAQAVRQWLKLHAENQHPKSDNMPWLTWAGSADQLKAAMFDDDCYKLWSMDLRMESQKPARLNAAQESLNAAVHTG